MNSQLVLKAGMCLAVVAMLALAGSAHAVLVSFEQSEGFGTPNTTFDGLTTTVGAGFGDEPPPITGTQIGEMGANAGLIASIEMDLDNSLGLSLTSFNYANRGGGPPRVNVKYFDTSDNFIGMNSYMVGPTGPCTCDGEGLGLQGFGPFFQQIQPRGEFVGVPLGKILFESTQNQGFDGHALGTNHASFMIEDIQLDTATKSKYNPNDHNIVDFDVAGTGHDGLDIEGYSVPGVATFNNLNTTAYMMRLDHGLIRITIDSCASLVG